jgi:hypothetical protein
MSLPCIAVPFGIGDDGGHCHWLAPTNIGKTTAKLCMLTDPKFGVVGQVEKIIWVSNENDPRLRRTKMQVIHNIPNYEDYYELICLKPELFTDEEKEDFAEWWNGKHEATDDDMMAWKLRGVFKSLRDREKTDKRFLLVLEDLSDQMKTRQFHFVEQRMGKMRNEFEENTILW